MLPGQGHPRGQAVSESLEYARESVAAMVGCEAFEIVFTSGGTEANNLAILGSAATQNHGHILVSAVEHDSVCEAAATLASRGWEVETIGCGNDGRIDPERVASQLRRTTRMVCLQAANPILGTLQPVREVADICHNRGIAVHCDATQIFGKTSESVSQLRADTVAISGHKIYGPKGSGALFVRRGFPMRPILFGESREMGLRPGVENVPAWIGLGAACMLAHRCADQASQAMTQLRDRLARGLQAAIDPVPRILCESSPRLSNTLAIELPANAKVVQRSARNVVFAAAMSESPPDEMTRCLLAAGENRDTAGRIVRLSIGWTTSQEQVDRAVELFAEALDLVRA